MKQKTRIRKQAGSAPGTLVHIGETTGTGTIADIHRYNADQFHQERISDPKSLPKHFTPGTVTWVQVIGVHDVAWIEAVGQRYHIHMLTLEDVMNTLQRPKWEDFGHYAYLVMTMLSGEGGQQPLTEQLSVILFEHGIITFQEKEGNFFAPLKERLANPKRRIRTQGADYLLYALMDLVVDHYTLVLEQCEEMIINSMEQLTSPEGTHLPLSGIGRFQGTLLAYRRFVRPTKEMIHGIIRSDAELFRDETLPYLRDVAGHIDDATESLDTLVELQRSALDIHVSLSGQKLNAMIKLLTLISTLFIPISFIAALYGMNFTRMPELHWEYGYPTVMALMAVIVGGLLLFFRTRRWI